MTLPPWVPQPWGASPVSNLPVTVVGTGDSLQSAINALQVTGGRILMVAGTYAVADGAKITIPVGCAPLDIIGLPHGYSVGGTVIQATGAWPANTPLFEIHSSYHRFTNLKFDANRKASNAWYLRGWSFGKASWCMFTNAITDGVYCDDTAGRLNDSNIYEQCIWDQNGVLFYTAPIAANYTTGTRTLIAGTATVAAGSNTIPIAGGPSAAALGIRTGTDKGDIIRVGANELTAYYGMIESVTTDGGGNITAIVVHGAARHLPTAAHAGAGLPFAIGVGDGYHEARYADNNLNRFDGCLFRHSGGSGARFNGLYGPTVIGGHSDYNNGAGVSIGDNDNAGLVRGAKFDHLYMEFNKVNWAVGQVRDIKIETHNDDATGVLFFGLGEGGATGVFIHNGLVENLQLGRPQNFLVEVKNDGGTYKVRLVSERFGGNSSFTTDKITNPSAAFVAIPSVDAGTAFAGGAGLVAGATSILVIDTANDQPIKPSGTFVVEFNDTGTSCTVWPRLASTNINGVTRNRLWLNLANAATGAPVNWNSIPVGTTVSVRVDCYLK